MTRLGVRVSVWAAAADELDPWLVSQDADGNPGAWESPLVAEIGPPKDRIHRAVRKLLRDHDALNQARVTHSTSWHEDVDALVCTYIAVLGGYGHVEGHGDFRFVREVWPEAIPVTLQAVAQLGQPAPHKATDRPEPRYFDVFKHGVRHLRFLLDTDAMVRAQLDGHWKRHLEQLQPTLAGMYERTLAG